MNASVTTRLSELHNGDKAHVVALRGGQGFQHRITSMGLSVGCEVEVMQHDPAGGECGTVAVRVGDTRLMLGAGMAAKVVVRTH